MKPIEERIRRLELWNRALITLLLLGALGVGGKMWGDAKLADAHNLRVQWKKSAEIRLYSITDRPMIVTHLVSTQTAKGKATAALSEPLAIHDSAGQTLSAQTVNALAWRDVYGKPTGAPPAGSKLQAFYFRPIVSRSKP